MSMFDKLASSEKETLVKTEYTDRSRFDRIKDFGKKIQSSSLWEINRIVKSSLISSLWIAIFLTIWLSKWCQKNEPTAKQWPKKSTEIPVNTMDEEALLYPHSTRQDLTTALKHQDSTLTNINTDTISPYNLYPHFSPKDYTRR